MLAVSSNKKKKARPSFGSREIENGAYPTSSGRRCCIDADGSRGCSIIYCCSSSNTKSNLIEIDWMLWSLDSGEWWYGFEWREVSIEGGFVRHILVAYSELGRAAYMMYVAF